MTAATAQRTLAQNALNASTTLGSRALGVSWWPYWITNNRCCWFGCWLYVYANQTAKATQRLAEQTDVANKTKEELLALQGVQKNGAKSELQETFKGQNKELKVKLCI